MVDTEAVEKLWILTTVLVAIVGVVGFVAGYCVGRFGHPPKRKEPTNAFRKGMIMAIKLGKTYTDTLHGVEGIATARTEYLTGCARVCLEFKDELDIKEYWFDETRLEKANLAPEQQRPGGPGAVAPSRDSPRR